MFVRYRFAAFVAVSYAGFAGSTAFAQERETGVADPVGGERIELQLTTEGDDSEPSILYSIQAALQDASADEAETAEAASDAEERSGLWLGVQLATEIPPALAHHLQDAKGALVETVYPDSPAAEGGIEAYDLIVRVGQAEVDSHEALVEAMKAVEAKPIDVVVMRGGKKKTISVTPRERATFQPDTTATAEATDLLFYNLNVPHIRVLPALTGPDAGAVHHRLVQTYGPTASLPENVASMKIHVERDGEKTMHRVEVTTVDGKVFQAANEEELKALPPEIRAALPMPRHEVKLAVRVDKAPGSREVRERVFASGAPTEARTPPVAVPPPAPVAPPVGPWIDILRERSSLRAESPAPAGDVTNRITGVSSPGEGLKELKKELSELRASVERIEKLLREKE